MLVLLTVFSMLTYEVFNKGITQAPEEADPTWLEKGGDDAHSTMAELPSGQSKPVEQPGLGGSLVRDPGTNTTASPPRE